MTGKFDVGDEKLFVRRDDNSLEPVNDYPDFWTIMTDRLNFANRLPDETMAYKFGKDQLYVRTSDGWKYIMTMGGPVNYGGRALRILRKTEVDADGYVETVYSDPKPVTGTTAQQHTFQTTQRWWPTFGGHWDTILYDYPYAGPLSTSFEFDLAGALPYMPDTAVAYTATVRATMSFVIQSSVGSYPIELDATDPGSWWYYNQRQVDSLKLARPYIGVNGVTAIELPETRYSTDFVQETSTSHLLRTHAVGMTLDGSEELPEVVDLYTREFYIPRSAGISNPMIVSIDTPSYTPYFQLPEKPSLQPDVTYRVTSLAMANMSTTVSLELGYVY